MTPTERLSAALDAIYFRQVCVFRSTMSSL